EEMTDQSIALHPIVLGGLTQAYKGVQQLDLVVETIHERSPPPTGPLGFIGDPRASCRQVLSFPVAVRGRGPRLVVECGGVLGPARACQFHLMAAAVAEAL